MRGLNIVLNHTMNAITAVGEVTYLDCGDEDGVVFSSDSLLNSLRLHGCSTETVHVRPYADLQISQRKRTRSGTMFDLNGLSHLTSNLRFELI